MTTMTTDAVTAAPRAAREGFWADYGRAWARTPGSAVYLLAVFVLAMVSVSLLASLFWTGVGLLVVIVGLPIVVGALFVARGFGIADRGLLRLTGLPPVAEPEWHGYVSSLFVRPDARGAGLGTRLLGAALAECDRRGCDAVVLWPTDFSPGVPQVFALNFGFVLMFAAAGALFRRAAAESNHASLSSSSSRA